MRAFIWMFVFALTVISSEAISCPRCSDPYDGSTCNLAQPCHHGHDVCELHVHTRDRNRIEYVCHILTACSSHESHACSPQHHEVCAYCCMGVDDCDRKLRDLFICTYHNSCSSYCQTDTRCFHKSPVLGSPIPSASTTPAITTTIGYGQPCLTCGDFARGVPCSSQDLFKATPQLCPSNRPYCFTAYTQNGTEIYGYKGCADANFCQKEYAITSTVPQCQKPAFSSTTTSDHYSCNFCCKGSNCNVELKPDDSTITTWP